MKNSGTKPRLKTLERASAELLPPLRLTHRDLELIKAVYEFRMLSTDHIVDLLFASDPDRPYGKRKRCQYRLKLLFHHGYLFRDALPTKLNEPRQPLIYFLDKKGAQLLAEILGVHISELDWNPQFNTVSQPFLMHLLKTTDVAIAITLAAQRQGFEIKEWLNEQTLKKQHSKDRVTITGPQGGTQKVPVIPDAYFHLWTGEKNFHQFIEVDLRTVVGQYSQAGRRDWARRIRAYIEYYRSGLYQQRYPGAGKSMRVLTVTTAETRLNNLKEITEKVAGKDKHRFWYTTFDQLTPETVFDRVWQIAGRSGLYPLIW